jgi:hypothetical protein
MSGMHRAQSHPSRARVGVAGAMTAGALLLAPIGAAVVAAPTANAITSKPVQHPSIQTVIKKVLRDLGIKPCPRREVVRSRPDTAK